MGKCVALTVPDSPEMLRLLQEWPAFSALWNAKTPIPEERQWLTPVWRPKYQNKIGIEVVDCFNIKDIYGNRYRPTPEEQRFWKQFEAYKVALPSSLTLGKFEGPKVPAYFGTILGEINVPFLQWAKHLAITAKADVEIYYEHERGDNPYEYAYWEFNYQGDNTVRERLLVEDYEGEAIAAEILWMKNGIINRNSWKLR
jgi:hypothetical protein